MKVFVGKRFVLLAIWLSNVARKVMDRGISILEKRLSPFEQMAFIHFLVKEKGVTLSSLLTPEPAPIADPRTSSIIITPPPNGSIKGLN